HGRRGVGLRRPGGRRANARTRGVARVGTALERTRRGELRFCCRDHIPGEPQRLGRCLRLRPRGDAADHPAGGGSRPAAAGVLTRGADRRAHRTELLEANHRRGVPPDKINDCLASYPPQLLVPLALSFGPSSIWGWVSPPWRRSSWNLRSRAFSPWSFTTTSRSWQSR